MTFHPPAPRAVATPPCLSTTARADVSFIDGVLELRPALMAFALRRTSRTCDAENLVQDTILRALAARHRLTSGTNLKAWLFIIRRISFSTGWRRRA